MALVEQVPLLDEALDERVRRQRAERQRRRAGEAVLEPAVHDRMHPLDWYAQ